MTVERGIVVSTLAASALALAMVVLSLVTGVSQEWFETVHVSADYSRTLASQATMLKLGFTFDNLFLLGYATFFALFCVERWNKAPKMLVLLVLILGELTAVFDMAENHNILSMLATAKLNIAPTHQEIGFQVAESAVKFHLSYLALIFGAFIYPRDTLLGRLIAWGIGVGYPVLGVAIFTAPEMIAPWLSLARGLFFVVGFGATAFVYFKRKPAEAT